MTNFKDIQSKNFVKMATFIDTLLYGNCDICPAYNICKTDNFNKKHCEPYLRIWLLSEKKEEE